MCARQALCHWAMSSAHVSVFKGLKHLRSLVCRHLELSPISYSFLVIESNIDQDRYVGPATWNSSCLHLPSAWITDISRLNYLRKMQKESGLRNLYLKCLVGGLSDSVVFAPSELQPSQREASMSWYKYNMLANYNSVCFCLLVFWFVKMSSALFT